MKKTLIALAALGAMAGAANAQSTVTLYGLLDADVGGYKNNVSQTVLGVTSLQSVTQTKIESGGLNGSRWGMRVKEDIGGGMAIVGNLESGFDISNGTSSQGSRLFGRRANVGVAAGFGTVVIGRNTSSYDDVSADHAMMGQTIFDPSNTNNGTNGATLAAVAAAPTAANLVAAGADFLNRNATWVGYASRFDNSIKYSSPVFSGFSGGFMYATGENKTATVSASDTVSANLKYANGPLLVSGGYQNEGFARTAAAKPSLENALLSVAYDFGMAKVGAGFNRAKYKEITATGADVPSQDEWNLSVAVPFGATTLSAGYARSKGDALGTSSGFGVQALYALSKRTTLYAGALSTESYDLLEARVKAAAPTSDIGKIQTYAVGMRHTF